MWDSFSKQTHEPGIFLLHLLLKMLFVCNTLCRCRGSMSLGHGQLLFEIHPPSFSAQIRSNYKSGSLVKLLPFHLANTRQQVLLIRPNRKWNQTFQFSNKNWVVSPPQRFPQSFRHQQVVACRIHEPWICCFFKSFAVGLILLCTDWFLLKLLQSKLDITLSKKHPIRMISRVAIIGRLLTYARQQSIDRLIN